MTRLITAAVCVAIISAAQDVDAQFWPEPTGASSLARSSLDYPRIQPGDEKNGIWGDVDDAEWNDAYYDAWRYSGRGGERLVVSVTATPSEQILSFSPIVYVYAIGASDSIGPIADARLITWRGSGYTRTVVSTLLATDGDYLIVVQPDRPDRSGMYSISVASSRPLHGDSEPSPTVWTTPPSVPSSRCSARTNQMLVEFTCPSNWRRTEWNNKTNMRDAEDRSPGVRSVQVNYRDSHDWRVNLNVRVFEDGQDDTPWGFGSAVWFTLDDYVHHTRSAYPSASVVRGIQLRDTSWRAFAIEIRRGLSRSCAPYPCMIDFQDLGNIVPVDFLLQWRPREAAPERFQGRDVPDSLRAGLTNEFGSLWGSTHAYAATKRGRDLIVIAVTGLDAAEVRERLREVVESIRIESVQ